MTEPNDATITMRSLKNAADGLREVDAAVAEALESGRWMVPVFWVDSDDVLQVRRVTSNFPRNRFMESLAEMAAMLVADNRADKNMREADALLPQGPRVFDGGNGEDCFGFPVVDAPAEKSELQIGADATDVEFDAMSNENVSPSPCSPLDPEPDESSADAKSPVDGGIEDMGAPAESDPKCPDKQ